MAAHRAITGAGYRVSQGGVSISPVMQGGIAYLPIVFHQALELLTEVGWHPLRVVLAGIPHIVPGEAASGKTKYEELYRTKLKLDKEIEEVKGLYEASGKALAGKQLELDRAEAHLQTQQEHNQTKLVVWIQTPHSGIPGPPGACGGVNSAVPKLRQAQNRPGPSRKGTRERQP